jgi:hypothetical protein
MDDMDVSSAIDSVSQCLEPPPNAISDSTQHVVVIKQKRKKLRKLCEGCTKRPSYGPIGGAKSSARFCKKMCGCVHALDQGAL